MNFLFSAYQWREILFLRSKWACRGELLLLSAICGYPISPIFADICFSRISAKCGDFLHKVHLTILLSFPRTKPSSTLTTKSYAPEF